MSKTKKFGASVYAVSSYSVPRLHEGKKWYIDFLCLDPVEGKMRRKKYHLDGITSVRERRKRANELIAQIAERLRRGWNVWAEQATESRHYTLYSEVVEYFVRYHEKLVRTGVLRQSSWARQLSYLKIWNEWLTDYRVRPVVYVYQLTQEVFGDFLDFVLMDRDVSALTHNNYRVWLSTFCSWLVQKGYIPENPVAGIKALKEDPKRRDALSREDLATLRSYLQERNPHFLLACMLEYYTFIRPEELTHLKVGDFKVKEMKVVLSGEHTKNRKDAAVAVNSGVFRLMSELGVFRHPSGDYLFGGKDFRPGAQRIEARSFRDEWIKMRRALRWPDSYQFYSLKDTGIRDLANAEGIVVARDQARHSDVGITNKYLKGDAMKVHEEVNHFEGGL